jgi:rubrerythrin
MNRKRGKELHRSAGQHPLFPEKEVMGMPLQEILQSLVKAGPGKKTFLSVCLDLSPDGSGKKRHFVFLKSRLSELAKTPPAHSREQTLLARDLRRVQKYLEEDLDPAWRGIALFACPSADLFLAVPMSLPPANSLALSPYPHLFSLARQADLYQPYGILAADSRQARLFLVREGRPEKQISLFWEERHTTRFGRLGLSSQKFQRHKQEHIKQRAKEAVETLGKWIGRREIKYLFLASEEEMQGEIQKQLPAPLRKKRVPLASLDPRDPDHKILSGAMEALRRLSRERSEALARQIMEEAQPLGQATVGPEPTLSALQNHQVERLVLDGKFRATGWQCLVCGFPGMGGVPRSCPFCQGETRPAELREEIVWKAESQGVELFFTDGFAPLMKAGGIGALLKFKITGKPSRPSGG